MRIPRMTTRRWMVAVVVASLLLGALAMVLRSREYSRIASAHGKMELTLMIYSHVPGPEGLLRHRKERWHRELWWKYRNASRRPWLPLGPDPPEPR